MTSKRRLRILIYGDCYNEKVSQGLDYFTLMNPYGDLTLLTAGNADERMLDYDILLLPGGADVDPIRYGEKPSWECGRSNPQYEWLDQNFLPMWIESKKPIIGICRGLQTLNVALGGSLYQHVVSHMGDNNKRTQELHDIYSDIIADAGTPDEQDFRIYGVNSFHHQAVKRLAEGFNVLAWATAYRNCPSTRDPDNKFTKVRWIREKVKNAEGKWEENIIKESGLRYYGVMEIIKHNVRPYIAFQYHPENLLCPLFYYLVDEMFKEFKILK